MNDAISAMETRGLADLSRILREAVNLFENYKEPNPGTTWEATLKKYDPYGKLRILDELIRKLGNYGI